MTSTPGRPTIEEFQAYLRQEGCSVRAAARHFGVPRSTANRWAKAEVVTSGGSGGSTAAPPTRPPSRARGGTPAADLDPDDRDELVQTVRTARRSILGIVERVEAVVAGTPKDEVPNVDPRRTGVARDLAQAIRALVDTHPGLMSITDSQKAGNSLTADDRRRLLRGAQDTTEG